MPDPNTPVIVGVGQSVDRVDRPDYHRWSAADLAAQAAEHALTDSGAAGRLRAMIDVIATTRTFEDSGRLPAPFGTSNNFPRSIARRVGINPAMAIWSKLGGNTPQDLVSEMCGRLATGEFTVALVCGGEATSTVRAAVAQGTALDFSETIEGDVDDRGIGLEEVSDPRASEHGVWGPAPAYALIEHARRRRLGLDRDSYARDMATLFAGLAAVAHDNPRSAFSVPAYTPLDLIRIDQRNRMIADPYPLRLVSRDQVNLGAAVVITTLRTAQGAGIPDNQMVFLHGSAMATEPLLLDREDIGATPAAWDAARMAIDAAGTNADRIDYFDLYSCFPVAVSSMATDLFGMNADDPRPFTVTGGLPYFGGPGNNYSLHAIAEMVEVLRRNPGKLGFIGANGGHMSKYSAGIYSTSPAPWSPPVRRPADARNDNVPAMNVVERFEGGGIIDTYTVDHARDGPRTGIVVGRSAEGARFIARTAEGDRATMAAMTAQDCLGRACHVTHDVINRFTLA